MIVNGKAKEKNEVIYRISLSLIKGLNAHFALAFTRLKNANKQRLFYTLRQFGRENLSRGPDSCRWH